LYLWYNLHEIHNVLTNARIRESASRPSLD